MIKMQNSCLRISEHGLSIIHGQIMVETVAVKEVGRSGRGLSGCGAGSITMAADCRLAERCIMVGKWRPILAWWQETVTDEDSLTLNAQKN
jgi:hypothetical protein